MARKSSVIVLEQALVKSKAWLSLRGSSQSVFLIFRTKCKISKNGRRGKESVTIENNGELEFTYIEAERDYGITGPRFLRAIDDLIAKGFIDITATGMGVHKVKTCYAISTRWRLYGQPHFKQAKRRKRTKGWPGFKKKTTNENVVLQLTKTCEETGKATFTTNDFVRGLRFENVLKWRNNKWLSTKIA